MKKGKNFIYERKNFWKEYSQKEKKAAFDFAEKYKVFLDKCKTDRETIDFYEDRFSKRKYKNIDRSPAGKKVFRIARNKNAAIALIGNQPIKNGVNLIVSHIDAPRIDLKQNPLFEDKATDLGVLRTHYYGGVKKYQWMSTPLALHGVFVRNDGKLINLAIGEDIDDPVFVMPDLLPHLARKEQYTKKIGEAVDASRMNIIFNSIPYLKDKDLKETVKYNALHLLNEKYGIIEENFLSAELEIVPAGKARDSGLDKSMILGYGQDDRICAYTSSEAIFDTTGNSRTAIVFLADKEEIGSEGNTGAKSNFIIDFIADLLKYNKEKYDSYTLRKTLINSQILSADVNAGINPNFPNVHEKENAVHIGFGVSVTKFTGAGGKSGSNDANAEYTAKIIKLFNEEKVNWQIGALGKVDEGGGGTIAKFMAEYGAEVIDCGPGLLGMHSLYELSSKADIYSSYKAYKTFFSKS